MRTLYFVIPVYNEREALPNLLDSLRTVQIPANTNRKIVAVDDGSTDGSGELLTEEMTRGDLHIITHRHNQGIPRVYGDALMYLRTRLSADDVVIIIEGDMTSDVSRVPLFLQKIDAGSDIVIASREVSGGEYVRFPWYRVHASRLVNRTLRLLWDIPGVTDYTIFFRAYRGALLMKLLEKGFAFRARKSFAVNGELLLLLAPYTPHVSEVPLRYDYGLKKGPSKMKLFATLREYIRLTVLYQLISRAWLKDEVK